nr:hypothetical protein [uncultured Bacteroides sp.]
MEAYIMDYNSEQQTSNVLVEFIKEAQRGEYTAGKIPQDCRLEDSKDYLFDCSNAENETEGVLFLGLYY